MRPSPAGDVGGSDDCYSELSSKDFSRLVLLFVCSQAGDQDLAPAGEEGSCYMILGRRTTTDSIALAVLRGLLVLTRPSTHDVEAGCFSRKGLQDVSNLETDALK